MKTVTVTGSSPLEEALSEGEEEVVLVRDGHAVALVVSFDDEDLEWYAREREPAFIASIAKAREQVARGKTMSHQQVKAMFDDEGMPTGQSCQRRRENVPNQPVRK